jgi:hypothetical protein
MWFGLLEYRSVTGPERINRHLYRKTPLFAQFVKFNVQIEKPTTRRQPHATFGGDKLGR